MRIYSRASVQNFEDELDIMPWRHALSTYQCKQQPAHANSQELEPCRQKAVSGHVKPTGVCYLEIFKCATVLVNSLSLANGHQEPQKLAFGIKLLIQAMKKKEMGSQNSS